MKTNLKIVRNNLILKATLSDTDTYKVSRTKGFYTVSLYKKPTWVMGITSRCKDGRHVLLLDYDDTLFSVVMDDLRNLCREVSTPFYVFTTKERKVGKLDLIGNYHIICPEKFQVSRIVELQNMTHCDYTYRTMPLRNPYRSWVLRITEKGRRPAPMSLGIFEGDLRPPYLGNISTAHLGTMLKLYPNLKSIEYKHQDNSDVVYTNRYETINRVT